MAEDSKSLIPVSGTERASREVAIAFRDLLPAESHYRANANLGRKVLSSLANMFAIVALLLLVWNASIFGTIGLMIYIAAFISKKARNNRAIEKNQIAVDLLNDARYEDASMIFEELVKSEQTTSSHPIYIFNRGVAFLLSGQHLRAFSLFNSVSNGGTFTLSDTYYGILYSDMAVCLLLNGNLHEAKRYIEKASRSLRSKHQGILIFPQTLRLLREYHYSEAFDLIRQQWEASEKHLRYPFRRAMSLLLAFSAYRSGDADYIDPALAQLEPLSKESLRNEFFWLYHTWPELIEFLEAL